MQRVRLLLSAVLTGVLALALAVVVAPGRASAASHLVPCDGKSAPDRAFSAAGWYQDRTSWCKNAILVAQETGKHPGSLTAAYTITVVTAPKSLAVRVDITFVRIRASGSLANAVLTAQLPCTGCAPGKARGRTASVTSWQRNGSTVFDFTAGLGTGTDKIANHKFNPRFVLNRTITKNGDGTSFRCDNAQYISGKAGGCVFTQFVPTLSYSTRDGSPNRAVAIHINDAFTKPETTQPKLKGKAVPHTLHRDSSKVAANRRIISKICRGIDPNYTKKGLQCDEYPFASTAEGASRGDQRYSARPVDATQNGKAGNELGSFYDRNRILSVNSRQGGDAFNVVITH